ncbi:hypothetical protein BofuT4_P139860.1 [Botrytis cinerea T4]|uniref:Uncharacterized protein n=1 Tax=Botryotinia fuckeliana (strain T4) TaxID=999810 RepID=G2YN64_BOTF4|nr:hypothetical protein BofuT4_P139860.1 [Botrytis cinerea T4]
MLSKEVLRANSNPSIKTIYQYHQIRPPKQQIHHSKQQTLKPHVPPTTPAQRSKLRRESHLNPRYHWTQEEQSEIAKKLGESPEGDSLSNSGNQHELHLRNLSPRTEKIPSRNPKEPVRDLYRSSRDLVEKSGFETQSSTVEVTRKNLPPNIASPQAVPSLGIAAAVQRRKAGRNETRRRDGYSGTTQVVHHQCSNKSRV